MKIQILLLITIIIAFIYWQCFENFDARVSNVSKEKCGDMCTKIYNCSGFAYDEDNEKCYLSQNTVITSPMDSIYRDEYNPNFEFCNKPYPIRDTIDEQQFKALPKNTIYGCQDGDEGIASKQSIINDNIQNLKTQDDIIKVDQYKLKELIWPSFKKDLDPDYVTKDDYVNKLNMYDYDSKHEYQGTYLYPHKCVNNVPLFNCLMKCTLEDGCIGVEYNPMLLRKLDDGSFKKDTNVCCLKSSEWNKITRRPEHEGGAYYKKQLENDAYFGNIYIRNIKT